MTIATSTGRIQYNGNGVTTEFATNFKLLDTSHVEVILTSAAGTDTVQTISTHYTVTLGASTATVTMVTAPASGEKLTLRLNVPLTQTYDLVNGQAFNADTIESALDLGTQVDQSLAEGASRTLKMSTSASSDFDGTLPTATSNYVLRLNSDSTGFEAVDGATAFADAGGLAINDLVFDTTPQLGGDLDVNGKDITGTVKINGITYPSTDGTPGQTLSTDGDGSLVFSDAVEEIPVPFSNRNIKIIKNGIDGHYGFNSGILETDTEGKWVIVFRKANEHALEEGSSLFAIDTYDNGQTFTNERVIYRNASYDTRNFVTAKMNGRIGIIASLRDESSVCTRAKFIYSDDDGVTWTAQDMPQGVGAVDTYSTNFHGNVVSYPASAGGSDTNGFVAYSYTAGSIDALYTSDNGATWTWAFDIVSGVLQVSEMSVVRIGTQDKWVMIARTDGSELATSVSTSPISGWSTPADGNMDVNNNPVSMIYEGGEVWAFGMSRKGASIDPDYPSHLMYSRVDGDTLYANGGDFSVTNNEWLPFMAMPTWFTGYMFPAKINGKWYTTITCGEVGQGGSAGPKTTMLALMGHDYFITPPLMDEVAHPRKNLIVNGGFNAWTHGTSFSFTSTALQTIANGWRAAGSSGDTLAILQKTFDGAQNEVQDTPTHYLNFKSSIIGGSSSPYMATTLGRVADYQGKMCNLSFWARMPSGDKTDIGRIDVRRLFGTGGSPTSDAAIFVESAYSIGTEWQRYSLNVDLDITDGHVIGTNNDDVLEIRFYPKYAESSSFELDITNVKFELGSSPSRFEIETLEEILSRTGDLVEDPGTSGQVLTSNGAGSKPTFQDLDLPNPMERYGSILSISSGAVDISSYDGFGSFTLDTESLAASDDLDTITDTNAYNGKMILIWQNASARDITYKDNIGNLNLAGDFTPGSSPGRLLLSYFGGTWFEVSRSQN